MIKLSAFVLILSMMLIFFVSGCISQYDVKPLPDVSKTDTSSSIQNDSSTVTVHT